MDPNPTQLVLPISTDPDATWEHWVSRNETQLLEHALVGSPALTPPGILIWGEEGLGKSHLLQAVCAQLGRGASYIPLGVVMDAMPSAMLEGIESSSAVLIDDVHLSLTKPEWQEGLFHCFNRCVAAGTPLFVSSKTAISGLSDLLPDLTSRLALLTGFRLPSWEMDAFELLLIRLAKHRGLILTAEVARYLNRRLRHTPVDALVAIEKIERSSLIEQRTPTIPFLKTLGL
jgi:DnaA family protein